MDTQEVHANRKDYRDTPLKKEIDYHSLIEEMTERITKELLKIENPEVQKEILQRLRNNVSDHWSSELDCSKFRLEESERLYKIFTS